MTVKTAPQAPVLFHQIQEALKKHPPPDRVVIIANILSFLKHSKKQE